MDASLTGGQSGGVNIHSEIVSTGGAPIIGRDQNIGFSAEQVENLIAVASGQASADAATARRELGELQQRLGLTQGAALAVLRAIGEHEVPLEQLPQKLADASVHYQRTVERMAALDPQDPMTRGLVDRAQAAISEGRFGKADQLLGEAEQAEIVAAQQAKQLARQAQEAADVRLLRAANARGTRGNVALTQLRYLEAAQHFHEAADLVPPGHPDEKGQFLLARSRCLPTAR